MRIAVWYFEVAWPGSSSADDDRVIFRLQVCHINVDANVGIWNKHLEEYHDQMFRRHAENRANHSFSLHQVKPPLHYTLVELHAGHDDLSNLFPS